VKHPYNVILYWMSWVILALAGVIVSVLPFCSNDAHVLLKSWATGHAPDFSEGYRTMEQTWHSLPPGADVALVYRNFSADLESNKLFAVQFTHVGAAMLLPRRIYAGYDGTVLNDGKSIIDNHFDPTVRWMMERHIGMAFYSRINSEGALEMLSVGLPRDPLPEDLDRPPLAKTPGSTVSGGQP
jgi:hypothetical protein